MVAEGLARLGFLRFAIADPDPFELENLNRQNGSFVSTVGVNKAKVIAKIIKDINPDATVDVYEDGITRDNVQQFVKGCGIVVDETEFTLHELAVMLAREARAIGVPVVTGFNVGFGCLVTSFPAEGLTLEEYLDLDAEASLDEVLSAEVPLERWVSRLPSYISEEVVTQVAMGEISAPSVFPGVALAAGCVVSEVFSIVTGSRKSVQAPEWLWFDARDLVFEIVSNPPKG